MRSRLRSAAGRIRGALAEYVTSGDEQGYDESVAESFPASDSPSHDVHEQFHKS